MLQKTFSASTPPGPCTHWFIVRGSHRDSVDPASAPSFRSLKPLVRLEGITKTQNKSHDENSMQDGRRWDVCLRDESGFRKYCTLLL